LWLNVAPELRDGVTPSDIEHLGTIQSAVRIVNDGDIDTVDGVLAMFKKLPMGSIYLHRVTGPQDVAIVSKVQQLTAHDFMRPQRGYIDYGVFSQYCSTCGCVAIKQRGGQLVERGYMKNTMFYRTAIKTETDKVRKHHYEHLYGKHLNKWNKTNSGVMLEIGLGCTMAYGPGESAKIWPKMFNHVHFVEYNGTCVEKHMDTIKELDIDLHVGDQADLHFLEMMKYNISRDSASDGTLELVIDDGGHYNHQIIASLLSLWPSVKIGGMYFVEDFSESALSWGGYVDSPMNGEYAFGDDLPGTAQYFLRDRLKNLFCRVFEEAVPCLDLVFIECTLNLCVLAK